MKHHEQHFLVCIHCLNLTALKVDANRQKQSSAKTKSLPQSKAASSTTLYSNEMKGVVEGMGEG